MDHTGLIEFYSISAYIHIPDFMKTASMGRFHSKCGIYLFTQAISWPHHTLVSYSIGRINGDIRPNTPLSPLPSSPDSYPLTPSSACSDKPLLAHYMDERCRW